jgi:AcrR family transcriptional regulator
MGYDAASMNDITRAAGVSKGTIYVYFASKEELFEALIEEERQTIFSNLYNTLDAGQDPREALLRFGIALATKITSRNVMLAQRSVIGICERIPELGARFYERGPKRGHDALVRFMKAVAEKGFLDIADFDLAAYQFSDLCLAGVFRQCLFAYRTEPPAGEEIARIAASAVDVFFKAYGAGGLAKGSGAG